MHFKEGPLRRMHLVLGNIDFRRVMSLHVLEIKRMLSTSNYLYR